MRIRNFFIVIAFIGAMASSSAVHAGGKVLVTSALWARPTDHHACLVTNIGSTKITGLLVELIDSSGVVRHSETVNELLPQIAFALGDTPGEIQFAYCRFTGATSKKIRATEFVLFPSPGQNDTEAFNEAY
jgi:sugar/nucleoside kinase (ribokinase family)